MWLWVLCGLACTCWAGGPYQYDDPQTLPDRPTMVHLFEWKWLDIAEECENFLQYYGYGAVQVSPPNEHVMIEQNNDVPWWVRYQPISYNLDSRSGSTEEFKQMVERCNNVGVRIVVDVVMNHMVGVGVRSSDAHVWSSGSSDFDGSDGVERFPGVPWDASDFHDNQCHGDIQQDDYTQNADHVRLCRLTSLLDLNQRSPFVRSKLSNYLNTLVSIGVAGFRLDAGKHMYPEDIDAILTMTTNLRSDVFGDGKRPFVVSEVIDHGGEAISCYEYLNVGRYTNFNFGDAVSAAVRRDDDLANLGDMGDGFRYGNLASHDVLNFIDNHDNQRDDNPYVVTYKNGDLYRMAVTYMLAFDYGYTRVMSSFDFQDHDQGPPNNGKNTGYETASPFFNPDHTCDARSGFVCEHRWPTIRQMALFRSTVQNATMVEMVRDVNRLAFARQGKGFVVLNNDRTGQWKRRFDTTLPEGDYCDQYNGEKIDGSCTGPTLHVDRQGRVELTVSPANAVVLSLASRLS